MSKVEMYQLTSYGTLEDLGNNTEQYIKIYNTKPLAARVVSEIEGENNLLSRSVEAGR